MHGPFGLTVDHGGGDGAARGSGGGDGAARGSGGADGAARAAVVAVAEFGGKARKQFGHCASESCSGKQIVVLRSSETACPNKATNGLLQH
jgi:hypothetical protein